MSDWGGSEWQASEGSPVDGLSESDVVILLQSSHHWTLSGVYDDSVWREVFLVVECGPSFVLLDEVIY